MKTEIVITNNFQNEAKKYLKKFKSLKTELENLYSILLDNPKLGTLIGSSTYKIRLKVKSKGKGKSGGFRIITYLEISFTLDIPSNRLYLLTIYDKSETEKISKLEINRILRGLKSD